MALNKKLKNIIAVTIFILLIVTAFIFYVFDPEQTLFFPPCPFLVLTGYQCPGCGTQRAIHDLLHFNFLDAFRHNALILFLIPYIIMGFYLEILNGKKRLPRLEQFFFGKWAARIVIGIILLYWLLRNVL